VRLFGRLLSWILAIVCAAIGYQLYQSGALAKYFHPVEAKDSGQHIVPEQGDVRSIVEGGKLYEAPKTPGQVK